MCARRGEEYGSGQGSDYGASRDDERLGHSDGRESGRWAHERVFREAVESGAEEMGYRLHSVVNDVMSASRDAAEARDDWAARDARAAVVGLCRNDLVRLAREGDQEGFVARMEVLEDLDGRFAEAIQGGRGFVSKEGYEGGGELQHGSSTGNFDADARTIGDDVLKYLDGVRECLSQVDPGAGEMDSDLYLAACTMMGICRDNAERMSRGEWTESELEADWRQEQALDSLLMRVDAVRLLAEPDRRGSGSDS